MARIHGICFVLAFLFTGSFALSCALCDLSLCKPLDPSTCPLGVTRDICFCCPVCYKTEGEICGGPWNYHGTCGGELTCVIPPSPSEEYDSVDDFTSEGVCMETEENEIDEGEIDEVDTEKNEIDEDRIIEDEIEG
uniref:U52-Liphistoxin-Lsp1a_1 n=2 Tax=Liphistius TaxID=62150 RepID=A0A4V2H957_9ARAC